VAVLFDGDVDVVNCAALKPYYRIGAEEDVIYAF
jgi:hypothetical protein